MSNATNSNSVSPLGARGGNVSVIGAGQMGNGIAHVFAQAGFSVTLIDVNATQLEKAITTIGKNFDRQIAKGTITEDAKLLP